MATKHSQRKIQNYLIVKDMQIRIISRTLIYFLTVVILVVGLILSPLMLDMLFTIDADSQFHAAQTFLTVIKWLIPAVLIISTLIFFHQVIVTHRIYGPVHNFSKAFKKISKGDLSPRVTIRKKDYLHNECKRINEMISGLSGMISRIQTEHDQMISVMENQVARIKEMESQDDFRAALGAILSEARSVKRELSIFKLTPDIFDETIASKLKN